ncbi:MAG: hypothetical protein KDC18_08840 [Alphaproteobacteria bacterium]|nr:hypothetical protein [Alphaproteobacteria bacterium]MCB9931213.1 hypothetical protein [Alphaproteobacteria bacterium]
MSYGDLQGVRLPDAVTVQDGPIEDIARFLLTADQIARDRGIRLRVRRDIDELVALNRREAAAGNWYPLFPVFDPAQNEVDETNFYWISGTAENGETVVAQAGRLFDWHDPDPTALIARLLYPNARRHPPILLDRSSVKSVSGRVCFSGSTWFHPNYRRLGLSRILPRVSRVFAFGQWSTDWTISVVRREHVELNIASAYGYSDIQLGILAPGHPIGDLDIALVRMPRSELFSDIERFVAERLAVRRQVA